MTRVPATSTPQPVLDGVPRGGWVAVGRVVEGRMVGGQDDDVFDAVELRALEMYRAVRSSDVGTHLLLALVERGVGLAEAPPLGGAVGDELLGAGQGVGGDRVDRVLGAGDDRVGDAV